MVILFLLTTLIFSTHGHGFVEWQAGQDRSIYDQEALSDRKNYPIRVSKPVSFPRPFSRVPQVLLMIEEMQWSKNRDVDFYVYASDINVRGFKLNYHIGGPSLVTKLKVRWLGVLQEMVEVQYLELGFYELIRLRQGFGRRSHETDVYFTQTHYPTPKVLAFINGVKMELDDGDVYNLDVKVGAPTVRSVPIQLKTRDRCHVRSVRIALFITPLNNVILGFGGAAANDYNKFEEYSHPNPYTRRHERYERDVPFPFTLEPHLNILLVGINSFDANAKAGDVNLKVGHEYIKDQTFYMSFGTQGQTKLYSMHFALILRTPSPPKSLLQEEEKIVDKQ